jgi:hypothetical protein
MVKHRSGTRWRREARVFWLSLKTKVYGFLSLCLETGNCCLVILASKSLRRFLGLGLKTMWASVCRLHHKTNRGRSARDMR